MANGGTIEIDVELTGTKDIKESFGSIGQAGKSLAENMGATNEKLGEGLDSIGESVFGLVDSFGELKTGIATVGQTGVKGFMALLGPIGMVVTAGFALFETFKMISGAAQEAEENQSAMAAAAGDLQSKLEALAEKGVIPAAKEMKTFALNTLQSQFAKEKLQFATEKLNKKFAELRDAQEEVNRSQGKGIEITQENARQIIDSANASREAQERLAKANEAVNEAYEKFADQQKIVEEGLARDAKHYKKLEESSAEFLSAKVKENLERLKTIAIRAQEITQTEESLKLATIEIEKTIELQLIKARNNKENKEALAKQNAEVEKRINSFDEAELAEQKAMIETDKVRAEIESKRRSRIKTRRQSASKSRREAELAIQKMKQLELQRFAEGARIRQLQLESEEDSTLKLIQLARHRFDTARKLAGANLNQQLIARLSFENEVTKINRQAEQQRLQEKKQVEEQRRAFALESLNFDIQQIEDQTQRELLMLQVKHDEELRLAQDNEEQKQELQRRFSIQFLKTLNRETDEMKQKFKDMFADMGRGFAEAAVGAMLMGESFKDSTALVLQALARQAGVESLMETAKGLAALILNPAMASNHFAAAGAFGAAAAAAGAASRALGGGGGGGGGSFGGGGGMSPTGSPQTSSMTQREEATSSSMVFNVNFSGAVVYDTKRAAEQALADRVTKVMRRNRRGAPRS